MVTLFISRLPFLVVWVVALVLALSRWNKHPTVSVLVVTGAILQLVTALSGMVVPQLYGRLDGMSINLVSIGIGLISTAGLACLVSAVFTDRATRSDPPIR